jgi:hypothetical protein
LRTTGLVAPLVLDTAINGPAFLAYVRQPAPNSNGMFRGKGRYRVLWLEKIGRAAYRRPSSASPGI